MNNKESDMRYRTSFGAQKDNNNNKRPKLQSVYKGNKIPIKNHSSNDFDSRPERGKI